MNAKQTEKPDEKAADGRGGHLSKRQIKDMELAGGVEGGMRAGSAGGPSQEDAEKAKFDQNSSR